MAMFPTTSAYPQHDWRDHLGSEWTLRAEPAPLDLRPECGATSVVAHLGPRRLLLCEAPVDSDLPQYDRRLRARRRILGSAGEGPDIMVFTDAARSELVWNWAVPCSYGAVRNVEYRTPGRSGGLRRELASVGQVGVRAGEPAAEADPGLQQVLLRTLRADDMGDGGLRRLVRSIVDITDLADLRSLWRRLTRLTILDPACESGDWLISAGCFLEPIYLACLDRMRSWIDDANAPRSRPRRPEYLRDLRDLVGLAEEPDKHGSPTRFIRRLMLQRNLHGLAASEAKERTCRASLRRFAELEGPDLGLVDVNVVCASTDHRRAEGSAACGGQMGGEEWSEQRELLCWTLRMLRERRLSGNRDAIGMQAAARDLERRRQSLIAARPPGRFDEGTDLSAMLLRPDTSLDFDHVRSAGDEGE